MRAKIKPPKTFVPDFLAGYTSDQLVSLSYDDISKVIGQELKRVRGDDLSSSVKKKDDVPRSLKIINLDFGRSRRGRSS